MWLQFPELTLRKISTALREAELRKLGFLWSCILYLFSIPHTVSPSTFASCNSPFSYFFSISHISSSLHPMDVLILLPASSHVPRQGQFLLCPAPSHSCAGFLDIWPHTDPSSGQAEPGSAQAAVFPRAGHTWELHCPCVPNSPLKFGWNRSVLSGKWAGRCDLMLFVRPVEKPQGFCCCGGAAGQHQGPRLWDILQPISLALLCLSRSPLPCEAAVSIPKLPSL